MNIGRERYESGAALVLDLLAKYPQGITIKSFLEHGGRHLFPKDRTSNSLFTQLVKDGVLVMRETTNPTKGAYPRRFCIYSLAPAGTRAKLGQPKTPPPDTERKPKATAPPPPAENPERAELLRRGRELIAPMVALLGVEPDVELVLLRAGITYLEGRKL